MRRAPHHASVYQRERVAERRERTTRAVKPSPDSRVAQRALVAWRALPAWCKRPDFLAVLLVGALLRLLWLDSTSFLGDQAQLLAVARAALDQRAIPLTGIPSSIGTLNPPASIYLLLPFAWLNDPFWAALFTALANVATVVLLYRIADRYAGRTAAFAAGLLYATAAGPVFYARFIWQQNLLAPMLLLFFWTLCRGVVDRHPGRFGWLGWNLACWGVAVQLHPTTAPLLLLTAIGVLMTRAHLRWRDARNGALALALLFLPTAFWQIMSGGSDIGHLLASVGGTPVIDATAPGMLLFLLLPALPNALGESSPYAATYPTLGALLVVMALLAIASTLWLMMVVVRPLVPFTASALRRMTTHDASRRDDGRNRDLLLRVLDDPRWRFLALLALWELAPLAVMLRHSQPVYPHYLLVSLPAAFLVLGIFLARMPEATARLATAMQEHARTPGRRIAATVGRPLTWIHSHGSQALVALVFVLAATQAAGTSAQLVAIHQGAFDASAPISHYGWPLDDQRAALLAARSAARSLGASVTVASDGLHQQPLGYLAATGYGSASVYDASACLVTPAAGSPPQVTLSTGNGPARDLLLLMPGTTTIATLPPAAGLSPMLYRVAPGAAVAGETVLPPGPNTTGPRLAGYFYDSRGDGDMRLVMRWAGTPSLAVDPSQALRYYFGASPQPGAAPVGHYRFLAQPYDGSGHALSAPIAADCPRLEWGSGENVSAWVEYPDELTGQVASWRVWVDAAPFLVTRPSLGPLRFETGAVHEGPRVAVGTESVLPQA